MDRGVKLDNYTKYALVSNKLTYGDAPLSRLGGRDALPLCFPRLGCQLHLREDHPWGYLLPARTVAVGTTQLIMGANN